MKIILYTAVLGEYDTLPEIPSSTADAYCFTDNKNVVSNSWKIIEHNDSYNSVDERVRLARRYKMLPHLYFPDADIWIWADASFTWTQDPANTISYLGSNDIATFKYPDIYGFRDCIYQEAKACIKRGKDDTQTIIDQMEKYKRRGYKKHQGLVETTLLVRRNTRQVRDFNNLWWHEIQNGSRRDQLSFNYVIWALKMKYSILPGYRLKSDFGTWSKHKENIYLK
jgi:hypothetical protein